MEGEIHDETFWPPLTMTSLVPGSEGEAGEEGTGCCCCWYCWDCCSITSLLIGQRQGTSWTLWKAEWYWKNNARSAVEEGELSPNSQPYLWIHPRSEVWRRAGLVGVLRLERLRHMHLMKRRDRALRLLVRVVFLVGVGRDLRTGPATSEAQAAAGSTCNGRQSAAALVRRPLGAVQSRRLRMSANAIRSVPV